MYLYHNQKQENKIISYLNLDWVYVNFAFSGGIRPRICLDTSSKFPAQEAYFASMVVPRDTKEYSKGMISPYFNAKET